MEKIKRLMIADAAVRRFQAAGNRKTSMSEVAAEAGISRQSIYRYFPDRASLIRYIIDDRIKKISEELKSEFLRFKSLDEALVEGSLLSVRRARADPTIALLLRIEANHEVDLFLLEASASIREAMHKLWQPCLALARKNGSISSEIGDEDILEWLRHVHFVFTLRANQSESSQHALLRQFLVPSVINSRCSSRSAIE